jgi:hypothetical protein
MQPGWASCRLSGGALRPLEHDAFPKAKPLCWPANAVPVFLPPDSLELTPIARLWRDRKDTLVTLLTTTRAEWSDTVCALMQNSSHATLKSLTSFAYCMQVVVPAQEAMYGSLPIGNHIPCPVSSVSNATTASAGSCAPLYGT